MTRAPALPIAATTGIALVGVALFALLGLPLPWLLGPMFACLAAALLDLPLAAPPGVPVAMRTVLGVAVGAAITPELLARLPGMGISVALVPLFILVCGALEHALRGPVEDLFRRRDRRLVPEAGGP